MQYLYLLRAGQVHYKVGIASNVRSRMGGLQSHNPQLIQVVVSKLVEQPYDSEQELLATMSKFSSGGASEWFELTPEQAIETAIAINKYPDLDISEQATLNEMVRLQRRQQKTIEKKLDYIINTYQKFKPIVKEVDETIDIPNQPEPMLKNNDEEMFEKALEAVISEGKASTSFLQMKLRIGYGRAARIMSELEAHGHISAGDGNRPREVLVYSNL